jgi:hypothetical protein
VRGAAEASDDFVTPEGMSLRENGFWVLVGFLLREIGKTERENGAFVSPATESGNSAEAGVAAQTLNAAETVAARVNGEAITEALVAERNGRLRTGTPVADMPESLREPFESNLRDKVLNALVLKTLLMQKVREKRIVVSSREIAAASTARANCRRLNKGPSVLCETFEYVPPGWKCDIPAWLYRTGQEILTQT